MDIYEDAKRAIEKELKELEMITLMEDPDFQEAWKEVEEFLKER